MEKCMKAFVTLVFLVISINSFASTPKPKTVVCVEKTGSKTSVLVLDLAPNEGVVPNYDLTYMVNGKVYLSFETSLKETSDNSFSVQGYINDNHRSDVIGYAGYDLKTGKGYYQEAANDGMSPLPGSHFSSCKSF